MAGFGTGYPNFFLCPAVRRIYYKDRTDCDYRYHQISLTGRTRPTRKNGKGHPRKSWTTREWVCRCGLTGWSSHKSLERMENRER